MKWAACQVRLYLAVGNQNFCLDKVEVNLL